MQEAWNNASMMIGLRTRWRHRQTSVIKEGIPQQLDQHIWRLGFHLNTACLEAYSKFCCGQLASHNGVHELQQILSDIGLSDTKHCRANVARYHLHISHYNLASGARLQRYHSNELGGRCYSIISHHTVVAKALSRCFHTLCWRLMRHGCMHTFPSARPLMMSAVANWPS